MQSQGNYEHPQNSKNAINQPTNKLILISEYESTNLKTKLSKQLTEKG